MSILIDVGYIRVVYSILGKGQDNFREDFL